MFAPIIYVRLADTYDNKGFFPVAEFQKTKVVVRNQVGGLISFHHYRLVKAGGTIQWYVRIASTGEYVHFIRRSRDRVTWKRPSFGSHTDFTEIFFRVEE
jgi:hypothetical protein